MQVAKPKKGYKLVKTPFGKYEEIPEEWKFPTIGEYTEIIMGQAPPSSTYNTIGEGKLFVRVGEFGEIFPKKAIWTTMPLVEAKTSDVLICVVGATIGKINLGINCAITRSVAALRPKKELSQKFLYHFLIFNLNLVRQKSQGSAQGILAKSHINDMKIPLPPPLEQKQIASILSNVDDTLQKTNQIIEQTQRLKNGMMQKLLTRGIGHTKFKKTKIGEIPEKWEIKFLKDICKIVDTPHYTSPSFDNGIPIIRTSDCMQSGIIDYSNTRFTSKEEYEKRCKQIDPDVGDVLFTREAPCGVAVLVNRKEIAVGQRIILLKTNKEMTSNSFLVFFLNSSSGRRQTNLFSIKTTVERVNIQEIKKYSIPLPPLPEQKQIASILSNVDTQIQKEKLHKSNLERLKKGLMQKLLTGQIRVKIK